MAVGSVACNASFAGAVLVLIHTVLGFGLVGCVVPPTTFSLADPPPPRRIIIACAIYLTTFSVIVRSTSGDASKHVSVIMSTPVAILLTTP